MSQITIYHNPQCGTSRNTLELIRNSGEEPTVIEYLQTPPDRTTLVTLIKDMGIEVRALLRIKGTPYEELGLGDTSLTDDQLIDAMMAHPILINRPIVVTPWVHACVVRQRQSSTFCRKSSAAASSKKTDKSSLMRMAVGFKRM